MRKAFPFYLFQFLYVLAPLIAFQHIQYTPEDVTELQKVPLILQGETDWGGSVAYAGVSAYLLTLSFLVPLVIASSIPLGLPMKRSMIQAVPLVLFGAMLFVPIAGYFSLPSFNYFDCERSLSTLPLLLLFFCNYVYVCYLASKVKKRAELIGAAPLLSLVFLLLSLDGRTFKAGQVRQVIEVPSPEVRGIRHAIMTFPQRICYLPPFQTSKR